MTGDILMVVNIYTISTGLLLTKQCCWENIDIFIISSRKGLIRACLIAKEKEISCRCTRKPAFHDNL